MRILRAIVRPEPLLMTAGQMEIVEGGTVGAQLVGDYQLGCEALLPEQLAHEPQRGALIASGAEPICRGSRLRDRRHATDTFACRRCERPSHPGATAGSGGAAAPTAGARPPVRTLAPSVAPSHRRHRPRARRVAPPRPGSSV